MKKTERHLLKRCPDCGRRLFAGAIFRVIQEVRESGLEQVYGLNSDSLQHCTAIYFGCILSNNMTCPACGADTMETVEVEYSDKCELCDNPPDDRTWYWDSGRHRYVGLCVACASSPKGEAWIYARP